MLLAVMVVIFVAHNIVATVDLNYIDAWIAQQFKQ